MFCCLVAALFDPYFNTTDSLAYLDISDAIRHHLWHSAVDAYFFPAYPALLFLGRAVFGFHMRYEFMAARITDAVIQIFFIASSVVLVNSVRAVVRSRGVKIDELIPARTLSVWAAVFAYILAQDVSDIRPDALVSAFMILTAAAFLFAVARNSLAAFAAAGFCAALGEWTKAIAFPFFILCLFCVLIANLRRLQMWKGLAIALVVYATVAGPWIMVISKAKGRFTFGDSGRLTTAWIVNGADVFNPVADPSVYHPGDAVAHFKHAGTLLSREPIASYYNDGIYGTMPQWYDASYWFDGLKPRFVVHDSVRAVRRSLAALYRIADIHLQLMVLFAVPICFSFVLRRRAFADSNLLAMAVVGLGLIAIYMTVLLEARYIVFALMMFGSLFAGSCISRKQSDTRSLHIAVLLVAATIFLGQLQAGVVHWRELKGKNGTSPLTGIYDVSVQSAGAVLRSQFPEGSEVACMGGEACFHDPYWARYGGVRITGIIDTSHSVSILVADGAASVDQDCVSLEQHPDILNILRQHSIRAIVTRFDNEQPCSNNWKKLGTGNTFYYRVL